MAEGALHGTLGGNGMGIFAEQSPRGQPGEKGSTVTGTETPQVHPAAAALHCASWGAAAACLQLCQTCREESCAQPHWSTFAQKE